MCAGAYGARLAEVPPPLILFLVEPLPIDRQLSFAFTSKYSKRVSDGFRPFGNPVDYHGDGEPDVADLTMVLRLFLAREESRGDRSRPGQRSELLRELAKRHVMVLAARHQQYVLSDQVRNG